ncbi:hypothetical protein PTKIN_Ptkin14bG0092800 [Pterospermum kingtungense]
MACDLFSAATSSAVGRLMIDYLVKPIERHLHYLFRLSKIVEKFQQQEKKLIKERDRVKEDIQEAKRHIETQVIEKCVED